jgi:hypothetical protein
MAQSDSQSIDSAGSAEAASRLLANFFAGQNDFRSDDPTVQHPSLRETYQRFQRGATDRPLLLPFKSNASQCTIWYACAFDDAQLRALRAEMEAFVGPSYADFDPFGTDVESANRIAIPIISSAALKHFAFQVTKPIYDRTVLVRWQAYWNMIKRRPVRTVVQRFTFAQLRAHFDRALLAKNEQDARSAIGALRDQHGLSAENRLFLEIRLAATFGRWDQISKHPKLRYLVDLKLPPETYGDVLEALYEDQLKVWEQTPDPTDLIDAFRSEVQPLISSMLRVHGQSKRPAVLKVLLLNELTQATPNAEHSSKLLTELGKGHFGKSEAAIFAKVEALRPRVGLNEAIQEIYHERYEQAYAILVSIPDELDVLVAMLRCAREIEDPDIARSTLERLRSSNPSIKTQVSNEKRKLLQSVEKIATAKAVATTWHGKLALDPSDTVEVADYVVRWREIARSVDGREALKESNFAKCLADWSEELALTYPEVFESIYPVWFEWLIDRTPPDARYLPVYNALIESLRVRDHYGSTELELLQRVSLHIVRSGPTTDQYTKTVDDLLAVFNTVRAPETLGWALDVADALTVVSCRSVEARLRWITVTVQTGIEFIARLGLAERSLLQLIAKESGITVPADQSTIQQQTDHNNFCERFLLYSLDIQSLERAVLLLKTMYPESKFDVNGDENCSTRLKAAVRSADGIVFVSSVATHQAFYCIKNSKRDDSSLLQVVGSGTTRIVQHVARYASEKMGAGHDQNI